MEPTVLAASIVILLFSVILHEVMHGVVALLFGDHTAQRSGRLTLNPIPHVDLIGTILLPALLIISGSPVVFGWAKPVPVNPYNFSNFRKGELFVSAAGIAANFALALIAAVLFHLTLPFASSTVQTILQFAVDINLILAIFNLIPIPPLDGSKIVMSFLPPHLLQTYQSLEKYGLLILILLLFIPVGGTSILGLILGFFLGLFNNILGV